MARAEMGRFETHGRRSLQNSLEDSWRASLIWHLLTSLGSEYTL